MQRASFAQTERHLVTLLHRPQTATVHAITVQLQPGLSRADQSRFYKRMRLAMRRNRIITAGSAGICLNLGPREGNASREREVIVDWLIDQAPVRRIELLCMRSLKDVLEELFATDIAPDSQPVSLDRVVARHLLRQLLMGVIVQAVPLHGYAEEH